jgi:membrane protease subunit HflK
LPPAPIGELEVRRVAYARKTDVGFRTDLEMLARRAELTRFNPPDEWHSPVAAMNPDREQAAYLTADENLLELSFTVHYALADPVAFFYRVDHTHDFVELYAEAAARRLLAGRVAEELMTLERAAIEDGVQRALQERLDALGAGIAVTAVRIVDIHPPGESVFDFRDVSSAREDRETTVHQAHRRRAAEVPRARGEAALIVGRAEAAAGARVAEAAGRSEGFSARAAAVAPDRALLEHLLWLESAERSLAGRDKVIVPPGSGGGEVSLWRRRE